MLKQVGDLAAHGIVVKDVFAAVPDSKEPWARKVWVICEAPWAQYNRERKPGTYMGDFDGDVEAFVHRYRLRYPRAD